MSAIAFDTLKYAKKLREAGFSQQQAELQAEALSEIVEDRLATKQDLKELEMVTKQELKELEMRLTIRLGSLIAVAIGIVATLVKIL